MKKIIFLELNEVPELVFVNSFLKKNNYKKKLNDFLFYPTISKDIGHLSPWTTWATVHRGITDEVHGIKDINQDVTHLDKEYPTLMSSLADRGYSVGVMNSMHSASTPKNSFSKYSFFVPEAFANNYECNPKSVNDLQKLNLIMSKESARVVSKKLPNILIIFKAIKSYLKHSFKFNGAISTVKQLILELFKPWKKVRRRSLQSIILFDIFMDLLIKNKPHFSVFFTNHVASNMHRFWEAKFPHHYNSQINTTKWKERYKNEIDIAMKVSSRFINYLTDFVDQNKEYELWILSSMGQAAVQNYFVEENIWKITNIHDFINSITGLSLKFEELTQMVPCYAIKSDEKSINLIYKKLSHVKTNGKLNLRSKGKTTLGFSFGDCQYQNIWFKDKTTGKDIKVDGFKNIKVDEKTGSSAYHIPQGILYRYGNNIKNIDKAFFNEMGCLETHKIKAIVENFISI